MNSSSQILGIIIDVNLQRNTHTDPDLLTRIETSIWRLIHIIYITQTKKDVSREIDKIEDFPLSETLSIYRRLFLF